MDDGYIKFKCNFEKIDCIKFEDISNIIEIRNRLYKHKLIGCYPNNIAFGNISKRMTSKSFIITGTNTSCKAKISERDFSYVVNWNIKQNTITCKGLIQASSESLSHAAIYEILPDAYCVIHIHNNKLWEKYLNILPTSIQTAQYGTPEIALSIQQLIRKQPLNNTIVMGGHPDGIISWDLSPEKVFQNIINILK